MGTEKGLSQMYFLCSIKGVKLGWEMGRDQKQLKKALVQLKTAILSSPLKAACAHLHSAFLLSITDS